MRSLAGMSILVQMVQGLALGGEAAVKLDSIDDVAGWSINADGGRDVSFRSDATDYHSAPTAMRVTFAGNQWGNLRHSVTVPPNAVALVFWVRAHKASPGAAMHVWLMEPDGDGHCGRATIDGRDVPEWPTTWTRVTVPLGRFHHDPRGDRKPDLLSADRILLGFNFAPMEVSVDDFAWELRKGIGRLSMPRTDPFRVEPGQSGRIGTLDEPGLALTHLRETAQHLATTLRTGGFGVTVLRAGDLADPERLNRANFDLLVLPLGDRFPVEARMCLQKFLQAGGSLWTIGGYAFDQPVVYTTDGWKGIGTFETAAEIKGKHAPDTRINTRFGRPGDAMALDKMQIGMFDPSYTFERVARAEIGGRRIEGSLAGFAACITDPTGGPVAGKAHLRFIPLGQTYDRLGRPRGPLGGLAHHHAGPYAGSSWAFFGVTNRDLFTAAGVPGEFIASLARRLVDQVYLYGLTTDLACYRDGEPVKIGVQAANRGRSTQMARLQIRVEDQIILDQQLQLPPDNGQSRSVEVTWPPGRFNRDFYRVRAVLTLPYHTDELESAFCVWNETVVRGGPKLSLRDNYFRIGGRPTFLTGTNQTGRMWLSEYENPLVWRDDFAGMRDNGLVIWRVLHFSAVMHRNDPMALAEEIPRKVIRQTDAIVQLAQKYGVVLFLTLHDWMIPELTEEQLAAQAKWNGFWANRYKDVPGIMYDIQNEPSLGIPEAPHVVDEWKRFITQRHGSVEAAARLYGLAAADPSVLKPHAAGSSWDDLKAVDTERFRVHMLNRWIKANTDAVRQVAPNALVTVGFLQGMRPADKVLGADHLDFANMHSYTNLRDFARDFKILDRRAIGKTFSLGEFGTREAHDARVGGATGDRPDESIRRFMVTNHYVLGLGGLFTASWDWRDMPNCVFPWGLTRSDHLPKPVLRAYRNFTLMTRFIPPRYEPPRVWLILPDAFRLGPRWAQVQGALDQTIDVLLGLRIGFGVLREKDVADGALSKPLNARDAAGGAGAVLIWPMPYCPDDATFAAVKQAVERGGTLYLSGPILFDEQRRPTKANRLAELGLKPDASLRSFEVRAGGEVQKSSIGRGRVFYVPYPVETGQRQELHARLAGFFDCAGVQRLPIEPEHPDLHAFATAATDGATVYNWVNHGQPRTIRLSVGREPLRTDVPRVGYGLAAMDKAGHLTVIHAQGAVKRGVQTLLDTNADVMVVALDGRDLAESARLLVMPNSGGHFGLLSNRAWARPVATVGQVADGKFTILETVPLQWKDNQLTLDVDADRALSLILITEQADVASAGKQMSSALKFARS
jgi:hypothetical protein